MPSRARLPFAPSTVAASCLLLLAAARATELAPETFDEQTSGKTAFIMFRAPWCGHCKAMKPAWDELEKELSGSTTALVGHVDCTVHSNFCSDLGVQGYPTLRYGHPQNLEEYKGGRSIEELRKFAEEHLGPTCGPKSLEACDEGQKEKLQEWMALSAKDIDAKIAVHEASIAEAEKAFTDGVKELQERFEKIKKDKETAAEDAKVAGLGLLKVIRTHLKSAGAPEKAKSDDL